MVEAKGCNMTDYTFPVLENHAALSAAYCPLCGGEVDRQGDAPCDHGNRQGEDVAAAVLTLTRWAIHDPRLLRIVSHKLHEPTLTVRDLAARVGMGRSLVEDELQRARETLPLMARILGGANVTATAQRARRDREGEKRRGEVYRARCLAFYRGVEWGVVKGGSEEQIRMWKDGLRYAKQSERKQHGKDE